MSVELLKQIVDAKRLVYQAKESITLTLNSHDSRLMHYAIEKLNDALQVLVAMEEQEKR